MPEGSLEDHLKAGRPFSRHECKQILAQASDGLAYLHTLDPRIVHRDVTPNNILILHRRLDDIFVKFADFGMSREGDSLRSICGTYLYLAPEVHEANGISREQRATYTALVDIWSLGVVLARLLCGLPRYHGLQSMGVEWCKNVRQRVGAILGSGGHDLLSFVLESMLCLRPEARKTAVECHNEALILLARTQESNSEESNSGVSGGHCSDTLESEEASTIRPGGARKFGSESAKTGSGDLSVGTSSLGRYIISNAGRHVRSCNAPSAEPTQVHVGQLLPKLRDPEDSLFYNSSFGEDSNSSFGDGGGSSSGSKIDITRDVKPQDEQVEESPGSVLGFAAPPEPDDVEQILTNALEAMAEAGTCTGIEDDVALSAKRSRAAR